MVDFDVSEISMTLIVMRLDIISYIDRTYSVSTTHLHRV